MGITSENVAQRYGVTRQEQDQAAVSFTDKLIWSYLHMNNFAWILQFKHFDLH